MSKSAARAADLLFLPTCVFSSKLPSVVSVSSQIKIREHAEAVFAEDPDMKKLLVTSVVYKAEDLEKDPSLVEAVLRKEYLDEFEQLEANLFVANRLLPKSDTFHRGIAFSPSSSSAWRVTTTCGSAAWCVLGSGAREGPVPSLPNSRVRCACWKEVKGFFSQTRSTIDLRNTGGT